MIETTVVSPLGPSVDESLRSSSSSGSTELASLSDLAAAYKQAHWNVVGIDFSQLHELFDQCADQTP